LAQLGAEISWSEKMSKIGDDIKTHLACVVCGIVPSSGENLSINCLIKRG
jgi:hypothetical protein